MTDKPTPRQDTLPIEVTAVTSEGERVPVTVTLQYPHGMGAYAADSLAYLGELKGRILMELIQMEDASAIDRGVRAGILQDADDDQTEPTTSTTQED